MASLIITNIGTTSATWEVTGLSSPFNTTYYRYVTIRDGAGHSSTINAPTSGSSTSSGTSTISGLNPSTFYTFNAFAAAASDGTEYPAGSASFTTQALPQLSAPTISMSAIGSYGATATASTVPNATVYHFVCSTFDQSGASTVANITGLNPNTGYTVTCYVSAPGYSGNSGSASFTTAKLTLGTPSLSVSSITTSSASVSATSANSTANTTYSFSCSSGASQNTTSSTFNISGLSANTSYSVTCTTSDPNLNTSAQGSTNFTTAKLTLPSPTFASSSSTSSSVTVNINAISGYGTGIYYQFDIYQGATYIGSQYGQTTSYTKSSLTPSTTYRIYWYAHDVNGGYNDSATSYTDVITSAPVTLTTPTVSSFSEKYKSVVVTLNTVANASSYTVEVYTNPGGVFVNSWNASNPVQVVNLLTNTNYQFRQKAVGDGVNYLDSAWSGYTAFTTLADPQPPVFNTGLTTKGDGSVHLYWSSILYASDYKLEWRVAYSADVWSSSLSGGFTDKNVTGLVNAVQYEFRVSANVPDWGGFTGVSGLVYATPGLKTKFVGMDNCTRY